MKIIRSTALILALFMLGCMTVGCGSFEYPNVSDGLEFRLNDDGVSYSVVGVGSCEDTEIIITPNYKEKPVTEIGVLAFWGCDSLTAVSIPDSVTTIARFAFEGCENLTSVTIPDGVTSIGNASFDVCTSLTSITIPNSVTSIGDEAFYECTSLVSINYSGTAAEWNAIEKGAGWDNGTPSYTVHCTDGDIAK